MLLTQYTSLVTLRFELKSDVLSLLNACFIHFVVVVGSVIFYGPRSSYFINIGADIELNIGSVHPQFEQKRVAGISDVFSQKVTALGFYFASKKKMIIIK